MSKTTQNIINVKPIDGTKPESFLAYEATIERHLQAQGGLGPPSPKQLSASVGAAAICGARYWPESTPRAHASSVTQSPSLS